MKNLNITSTYKSIVALFMLSIVTTMAWAQDSTASSTTSSSSRVTTETTTGVEPWVWVVGAAVLIVIIVLLTRGSGGSKVVADRTDKVTYTKEVSKEDNL
ncbi:MAG TPA: hypothetical protein VNI52_12290 [Sphingobacteriaceae bacterium]|nr:hypothetical protein [Sphingobacteriaceae bacterium]